MSEQPIEKAVAIEATPVTAVAVPDTKSSLPDTQIRVTDLPSVGRAYPDGTEIHYKPYTFGEVKAFSQSKGKMSAAKSVERVLSGIDVNGMAKEDLTFFDFLYISLLRRLSTMNAIEFKLGVGCPKCHKPVTHTFSWEGLIFEDLPAPKLPIIVDICDKADVRFTPITVKQYQELTRKQQDEDPVAIAAMQSSLDFDEAYKTFSDAVGDDAALLDEIDKLLYHDLKPAQVTCVHCNHNFNAALDDEASLISPFRKSESASRARIRFGD
jgi:hypothetical protein